MLIKYVILGAALVSATNPLFAASIEAHVQNKKTSEALDNAIVMAFPKNAASAPVVSSDVYVVDQKDKKFVNYVTPVRAGASVSFPNHDKIRHHVYSFSKSKQFEIPLYKGVPAKPVHFDKAGEVSLGCNIHDWMKGFVYVSEAPYFARSNAQGTAVLENLPEGEYDIQVWHPTLRGKPKKTSQSIKLSSASDIQKIDFSIKQKKVWKTWRAPTTGAGSYK